MLHTDRKTNQNELADEHYSVMKNILKIAELSRFEKTRYEKISNDYAKNSADSFCTYNCEQLLRNTKDLDSKTCLSNCIKNYSNNLHVVSKKRNEIENLVRVHNEVGSNFFMH